MTDRPRLAAQDVACWVIKTSRAPGALVPGWAPGSGQRLHRCVRPSYRLDLMAPGQRCLLWLSGRAQPGVHAAGVLTGPPDDGPGGDGPAVEVELHLLAEPVPRAELLAAPAFAGAEVVRMPAGSNPSYLTGAQLQDVVDHLDPASLRQAGWA